jgi:ribulose-phosphate 3-epimerase
MSNILPAILAKNENDFRAKAAAAAIFADAAQIDVLDGTLFNETCWADPEAIASEHYPFRFDAHLMVANPEKIADAWIAAGAKRIIVHREAPGNIGKTLERVRKFDREFGLAFNPETDLAELEEFVPFIDYILLLGVNPGGQGRLFHPDTIGRVRILRAAHPSIKIGVDGGITDAAHLAHELMAAGADELIVGSALWKSKDPAAVYKAIVADASI